MFKIWDKEQKRMIEPVKLMEVRPVIDILGNLGILDITNGCEWKGIVPRNQYELLLPTGVKDINKKESYLGDIIKRPVPTYGKLSEIEKMSFGIVKKENHSNNMYIEWNYKSSYGGKAYWGTSKQGLSIIEENEIVGDIYTNPDMIKKEV